MECFKEALVRPCQYSEVTTPALIRSPRHKRPISYLRGMDGTHTMMD